MSDPLFPELESLRLKRRTTRAPLTNITAAQTFMTIHVTQLHIDTGVPDARCECPVALAIQDATGRCLEVHSDSVEYDLEKSVRLPERAINFIKMFDDWEPVEPFSFELEIP